MGAIRGPKTVHLKFKPDMIPEDTHPTQGHGPCASSASTRDFSNVVRSNIVNSSSRLSIPAISLRLRLQCSRGKHHWGLTAYTIDLDPRNNKMAKFIRNACPLTKPLRVAKTNSLSIHHAEALFFQGMETKKALPDQLSLGPRISSIMKGFCTTTGSTI